MTHSGRNAGVTVAEVNLAFLGDLISGLRGGETGYAYVVGPASRLLVHSEPKRSPPGTDYSKLPQVETVRAGGKFAATGRDREDRRVLTEFAPVPRMGWLVFVEQATSDALGSALLGIVYRWVWLFVFLSVVAVILLPARGYVRRLWEGRAGQPSGSV
jgi:two-component system, NtrC family, sensor kinase